jgi:hypothetical protein
MGDKEITINWGPKLDSRCDKTQNTSKGKAKEAEVEDSRVL